MFSKKGKKLTAFLLAVVMVFGVIPALDLGQEAEVAEAAITPDLAGGTYTEITFNDFGLGPQYGTSKITSTYVTGAYGGITGTTGWDKIAFSGLITWPSSSSANYIEIGNDGGNSKGFKILADQWTSPNGFYLYDNATLGWIGIIEPKDYATTPVAGRTTLLRLEFDVVGADLQIKCYVDKHYIKTLIYTNGFANTLSGNLTVNTASGESVTIQSYYECNPESEYIDFTFADFLGENGANTDSGLGASGSVTGTSSTSMTSAYGTNAYMKEHVAAKTLDNVAFVGYVTFSSDASSGSQLLQIGDLLKLRVENENRKRLEIVDAYNLSVRYWRSAGDIYSVGTIVSDGNGKYRYSNTSLVDNTFKIRLTFDIVNSVDYQVGVFVNDVSCGTFVVTGGVTKFTWAPIGVAVVKDQTVSYKSCIKKHDSGTIDHELTFHDFDREPNSGSVGDYMENMTVGNEDENVLGAGYYHDAVQLDVTNGYDGVAFTGYVKWSWDEKKEDAPVVFGTKLQFGNLFHYSPYYDEEAGEYALLLSQARDDDKTNMEWGRVYVPHVNLNNHYIKIRAEFAYHSDLNLSATSYYTVKTYVDDVWVGTVTMPIVNEFTQADIESENSKVLWYRAILLEAVANESISIISSYDEYTFSDFGIEDQIFVGNADQRYVGGANAGLGAEASYDGMAFTGYVKFPASCYDESNGVAAYLQFGDLTRAYLQTSTTLVFESLNDTETAWVKQGTIETKNLSQRWIQLRLEFDLNEDGTTYALRVYVDGEKVGTITLTPGNTSTLDYFSTLVYDSNGSGIGVKSYPNYDEGLTPELTNTDFDIADGTYSSKSGQFARGTDAYNTNVGSLTAKNLQNLNQKKFSTKVTFGGSGDALYVGATTETGEDGVAIKYNGSNITVGNAGTTTTISGANGKTITLDMALVDDDADGNEDDLQVGIYVDGEFASEVLLENYKESFGTYLYAKGSSVTLKSIERTIDEKTYERRSLTDVTNQGTVDKGADTLEDGMLVTKRDKSNGSTYMNDWGEMADEANHVAYGTVFQKVGDDCYYYSVQYGTQGENNTGTTQGITIGIEFEESTGITRLYARNNFSVFSEKWSLAEGIDINKEQKIELTTDYIDADADGLIDDVMLGVWLNGKLASNKYLFLIDYVQYMGKGVAYSGGSEGCEFKIYQVIEKDLFAETYDLNLQPNGYQIPEYEEVTIKDTYDTTAEDVLYKSPTNKTYKKIGTFETTHQSHGSVYNREVTITMLSDANMDSVFDIADLVRMKKLVAKQVSYDTKDAIQMANVDMGVWSTLEWSNGIAYNSDGTEVTEEKLKEYANADTTIGTTDTQGIRDILLNRYTAKDILETRDSKMRVGVMSDTHLRADGIYDVQRQYNYREALEYYRNQRSEVIVLNGDISDLGEETSYDKLIDIFNEVYYKEYTYSDFGLADQSVSGDGKALHISGKNTLISEKKSLDRVAISGYVTWDETAPNGGGGLRIGKILTIRPETDKTLRIATNINEGDNGQTIETWIGKVDLGRDYKGEKLKFRLEFDLDAAGTNYDVKIYVDDVYKGTFNLDWTERAANNTENVSNSVELFKLDTSMIIMAANGETVDFASTTVADSQRPTILTTADNHEYYDAWWWSNRVAAADYDSTKHAAYTDVTYGSDNIIDYYYLNGWTPADTESMKALKAVKDLFYEKMEEWGVQIGGELTGTITAEGAGGVTTTGTVTTRHRQVKVGKDNIVPADSTEFEGYHFITVNEDYLLGGQAGYTNETLNWLTNTAIKAANNNEPGKPIFVFVHQPMKNTTVGSEYNGDGNAILLGSTTSGNGLLSLSDASNVIIFGGHTHSPITDDKSIYQGTFTAVNTASTYYASMKEYTVHDAEVARSQGNEYLVSYADEGKDIYKFSQGLLLEIEGTTTDIKRIDFWNTESAGEDWTVDVSQGTSGFQYTDEKQTEASQAKQEDEATAMVFNNDLLDIEYTSRTSVNLMFDAAAYENETAKNTSVHRYIVTVMKGATVVQTLTFRSYRYLGTENMPDRLVLPVSGLEEGVKYNFKIVAEDTWGTQSEPLVESMYCYHY